MKNETQHESLESLLQKEFISRCKKNSSYSLRAFASFLEIDQSNLSKVLNGKRELSKKSAEKIGNKLGLKPSAINELYFEPKLKNDFITLEDDQFEAISEWHHFAILELIKTKSFDPTPQKIATRLGLHVEQVRAAVARLQRLELIKIQNKKWILCSQGNTWTNTKTTTAARKLLQKALLEESLKALEHVPFENRDHSSLTIAIDKKKLPEFKEKLKQIRQDLGKYLQKQSPNPNEVYQLTLSFFPISKIQGDHYE